MTLKIERKLPALRSVNNLRQNFLNFGTRHSISPQCCNNRYPVLACSALMNFRKSRNFNLAL